MTVDYSTPSGLPEAIRQWVVAASGLADAQVIWSDGARRPAGAYIAITYIGERDYGDDAISKTANALVLAPFAAAFVAATNLGTAAAHTLLTGDGPLRLTGSPPSGLALVTDYWAIKIAANTFKLAATFLASLAGTPVVDVLADGAATVNTTAASKRVGREVLVEVEGSRALELRLQAYSPLPFGAPSILSRLRTRSQLSEVDAILDDAGAAVASLGAATHVPVARSTTEYESRGVIELTLNTTASESSFLGQITTVRGTVGTAEIAVDFEAPSE